MTARWSSQFEFAGRAPSPKRNKKVSSLTDDDFRSQASRDRDGRKTDVQSLQERVRSLVDRPLSPQEQQKSSLEDDLDSSWKKKTAEKVKMERQNSLEKLKGAKDISRDRGFEAPAEVIESPRDASELNFESPRGALTRGLESPRDLGRELDAKWKKVDTGGSEEKPALEVRPSEEIYPLEDQITPLTPIAKAEKSLLPNMRVRAPAATAIVNEVRVYEVKTDDLFSNMPKIRSGSSKLQPMFRRTNSDGAVEERRARRRANSAASLLAKGKGGFDPNEFLRELQVGNKKATIERRGSRSGELGGRGHPPRTRRSMNHTDTLREQLQKQMREEQSRDWTRGTDKADGMRISALLAQREELARYVPSLACEIDDEHTNPNPAPYQNSHQFQSSMLTQLQAYVESTAVPALEALQELRREFDMEMRRSQQQMESVTRQNQMLKAKLSDLAILKRQHEDEIDELKEANENVLNLLNANKMRADESKADSLVDSIGEQLANKSSKLNDALEEVQVLEEHQQELEDHLKYYYKKVNELEYERDFYKSDKRTWEKKFLEVQAQLAEQSEVVTRMRSQSDAALLMPYQRDGDSYPLQDDTNIVEIPYDTDLEKVPGLNMDMFKKTQDGDVQVFSLNQELEIEEYENADDNWLDDEEEFDASEEESFSSEKSELEVPPEEGRLQRSLSLPQLVEPEVVRRPRSASVVELNEGIGITPVKSPRPTLSISQSVSDLNVGFNSPLVSPRALADSAPAKLEIASASQNIAPTLDIPADPDPKPSRIKSPRSPKYIPGMRKKVNEKKAKKNKVGTAKLIRYGPSGKPMPKMEGRGFKAAMKLWKKMEDINPDAIVPDKDGESGVQTRLVKKELDQLKKQIKKKSSGNADASFLTKTNTRVVASIRTRHKHHYLNPKLKSLLEVPKSSQHTRSWMKKFGHNYYVCLDGLPATTTVDPEAPDWSRDKKDDELRPSLFWFENEQKYLELKGLVKSMPVRSKQFQTLFSKFALGIVIIAKQSTVNVEEKRGVDRLSAMIGEDIKLPEDVAEFPDDCPEEDRDFFLVTKGVAGGWDSHKFRAATEALRDKWLFFIRRLVKKRLLSQGGGSFAVRSLMTSSFKSGLKLSTHAEGVFKRKKPVPGKGAGKKGTAGGVKRKFGNKLGLGLNPPKQDKPPPRKRLTRSMSDKTIEVNMFIKQSEQTGGTKLPEVPSGSRASVTNSPAPVANGHDPSLLPLGDSATMADPPPLSIKTGSIRNL